MIGRTTSSRALVLTAPRELEFRDLPVPHPEVDGALLRVEACGLCGTDHEMFTGRLPAAAPDPLHDSQEVSRFNRIVLAAPFASSSNVSFIGNCRSAPR